MEFIEKIPFIGILTVASTICYVRRKQSQGQPCASAYMHTVGLCQRVFRLGSRSFLQKKKSWFYMLSAGWRSWVSTSQLQNVCCSSSVDLTHRSLFWCLLDGTGAYPQDSHICFFLFGCKICTGVCLQTQHQLCTLHSCHTPAWSRLLVFMNASRLLYSTLCASNAP